MSKQTHEQRLLEALRDGRPHSHHELYRLGMIVHSRVASLRAKGHVIRSWRAEGSYWYQLGALDRAGEIGVPPFVVSTPVRSSASVPSGTPQELPTDALQLSLTEAA